MAALQFERDTRRPPPAPAPDEAALWQRVRESRDPAARGALATLHLPYARIVAATYYARRSHDEVEFDDYLQLARLGMLEAIDRYDPAGGAQFRTFAARRMHGAILDGLESMSERQQQLAARKRAQADRLQSLRREGGDAESGDGSLGPTDADERLFQRLADIGIGLALGILLEDTGMYEDESGARAAPDQPYQQLELRHTQRHLRGLLAELPDVQHLVIRNHYLRGQAFDEIARALDLSKGRVSQIHKQALSTLRELVGVQRRCDIAF